MQVVVDLLDPVTLKWRHFCTLRLVEGRAVTDSREASEFLTALAPRDVNGELREPADGLDYLDAVMLALRDNVDYTARFVSQEEADTWAAAAREKRKARRARDTAKAARTPPHPVAQEAFPGPLRRGPRGPRGPAGESGTPGAPGPEGPPGIDGLPGADGRSAYEVWVDEGNIGTEDDFLASLVGPPGAEGPEGPIGLTGPEGPQGDIGLTGPEGPPGADGADGATGPAGPTGPAGADGLAGPAGPEGPEGPQGPQGDIGLTGPEGDVGPTGLTGPQGDIGLTGPEGPQGDVGLTGPEGPEGPAGPPGDGADATAAIAAHSADTTAVHGIADTAALILEGDARLTDARTPTAHTHPQSDITDLSAALAALNTALAAKAPLASPTFTGTVVIPDLPSGYGAPDYAKAVNLGSLFGVLAFQAYAPLASPAFTGTPTAPTTDVQDDSTKLATTAFVWDHVMSLNTSLTGTLAPKASPVFTGNPAAPTPTVGDNDTSIATTAFVQTAVAAGAALAVDYMKAPVRAATTANLVINSYGSTGGGTITLPGGTTSLTIDGVTLADGDRVLIANVDTNAARGIYDVSGVGTQVVLTRSADANIATELAPGILVPVAEGTVNKGTLWRHNPAANPVVVGTTALRFTRVSPPASPLPDLDSTQPVPSVGGGTMTRVRQANYSRNAPLANLAPLLSGRIQVIGGFVIPAGETVTNVVFASGTTAGAALLNQWAGIATATGLSILGQSADRTTEAWAANTLKQFPLTTPYTPSVDTPVTFFLNVTGTVPSLFGVSTSAILNAFAPVMSATGSTARTTPPTAGSTLGTLTAVAITPYCGWN